MKKIKSGHWFSLALIVLILLVWFFITASQKSLNLQGAQLLPQSMALPNFHLQDHEGRVVTAESFSSLQPKTWSLLFFGYTTCPDVCPLEMQRLGRLLERLAADNIEPLPQVVFISVDPERDTPTLLKQYVNYFGATMLGLRGSNKDIAKLAKGLGVSYSRKAIIDEKVYLIQPGANLPEGAGEDYLVNHSSRIFLLNPRGEYAGSFPPPHDSDIMYADMLQLLNTGLDE